VERLPAPFIVYSYPDHWLQNGSGSQSGGLKSEPEANSGFQRVSRKVEGTLSRSLPIWKRCLDIFGSLFLLALSSTLFFALAVYIKLVSPGPVFFRQKRVGYRATTFTFLKFRTMCANSDPRSHQVHLKELINTDQPMEKLDSGRDSRIIPGGRIVRKSCLDELPQLLNVLKGDMSLVGPRPCLTYEAEEYLRWHSHRFDVLPGITGLWQVSGKNKLTFKQMVRMDISYCRNMSLWLDLKILLLTLPTIIGFVFEGVVNRLGRTGLMPEIESTEESPKSDRVPNSIAEQI